MHLTTSLISEERAAAVAELSASSAVNAGAASLQSEIAGIEAGACCAGAAAIANAVPAAAASGNCQQAEHTDQDDNGDMQKTVLFHFCTSLFPKKLSENVLFVALILIQRQYRQNESGSEQIAYIIQERAALEEHSDCAENKSGDCK